MRLLLVLVLEWIFPLRGTRAQLVTQLDVQVAVPEGAPLELRCNYSTSVTPYLFWYVQYPSQSPQLLLKYTSGNTEVKGSKGFEATFKKSETSFPLRKRSAHWSDSAEYFCALSDTPFGFQKLIFGTGTRLLVIPNIRDPAPAVYQLRSPKSNSIVCLYTDFDSQSNQSTDLLKLDTETFQSNQTTLDMRSMDSKSNGILFWNSRPDFACNNNSNKSSGIVCDAKLVEKSFETDMHLNFQNLSVIGFRILLLKVAGFNLLMTLRLWSR
ncbi:T cell receptor alpha chain MC.7.G5-like [Echinops telfairi]|uniref:T cell receptor alpha chain MC.7.G5-like n=1 Tax=Echinops telfairi TaxID=9371 RepID=UPI001E1D39EF|nr:T cell receptor alpha chain MC.7.G5-like [Echinops telfairi]